jgi:hypothetical protein
VLSRFLLEKVEKSLKEQGLCQYHHVLYFFFDDKYDTQRSAISCLRSLLHQLIQLVPALISHVMPHYHSLGNNLVQSLGTLWEIFCAAIKDRDRLQGVYLIVDALHECDEASRGQLLKLFEDHFNSRLSDCSNTPFLKVLATSRPYEEIKRLLQPCETSFCIRLKTENSEEEINGDIVLFISHKIDELRACNFGSSLLQGIEVILTTKADGMFLWVSLFIKDLQLTPVERIREKLKGAPTGLDNLYRGLIDQLNQNPVIAEMATKILMWVVYAPSPMSIDELAWACTVKSDHKSISCVDNSLIESFRFNIPNWTSIEVR